MTELSSQTIDFSYLTASLEQDAALRENMKLAVRDLERDLKKCQAIINNVHSVNSQDTPALLTLLTPLLPAVRTSLASLAALIPPTQFYRYSDSFANSLRLASYLIVSRAFLERDELAGKEEVERELGLKEEWKDHFFLSTEYYLHSIITLLNELSRLAVNRVTLGDFEAPVQFAKFAKEISSAFGLLNLKNDSLRKRFDGIKYDVKKLEEVVYDLSLRGLLKSSPRVGEEGQGPTKRARND